MPVAIVLHMPVGYTELYARKLNEQSALDVVEATDGEAVTSGTVYHRAGGAPPHFSARSGSGASSPTSTCVRSTRRTGRRSTCCSQSAAESTATRVLGVVMTGMGSDGREGRGVDQGEGRHRC